MKQTILIMSMFIEELTSIIKFTEGLINIIKFIEELTSIIKFTEGLTNIIKFIEELTNTKSYNDMFDQNH
jgi:uncharacterized protein YkvS